MQLNGNLVSRKRRGPSADMRPSSSFLRSLLFILASVGAANAIEVDAATFAKQNFDFIVCGGGTAGTALAVRCVRSAGFTLYAQGFSTQLRVQTV